METGARAAGGCGRGLGPAECLLPEQRDRGPRGRRGPAHRPRCDRQRPGGLGRRARPAGPAGRRRFLDTPALGPPAVACALRTGAALRDRSGCRGGEGVPGAVAAAGGRAGAGGTTRTGGARRATARGCGRGSLAGSRRPSGRARGPRARSRRGGATCERGGARRRHALRRRDPAARPPASGPGRGLRASARASGRSAHARDLDAGTRTRLYRAWR